MRHMMLSMPGVERQILFERDHAKLGMTKGPLPLGGRDPTQRHRPALMERIQQSKRQLHRSSLGLRQFGPQIFHIRANRWLLLSQCERKPDIRVHMAVGHMMHNLTYGPAPVAI